ncbi:phosphatidate cytidylyltransferase [Bacteroidia bacterium]|nr:phosphatidate cytidylyltransferase [Bacteroidia bacterium]
MKSLSNFQQRTLTGIVLVAAIVSSLLHFVSFSILFGIIMVGCLFEFNQILQKTSARTDFRMALPVGVLFYIVHICVVSTSGVTFLERAISCFFLIGVFSVALFLILFIAELFEKRIPFFQNTTGALLTFYYLVIPFVFLLQLYVLNRHYVLALFVMVWTYDTFAYLTGMKFGKHRLCERISPKKSWEGAIGGFIATLAVSLVFWRYTNDKSVLFWLGYAAIVVVFSTFGDLLESLFKRHVGIKDSGALLPGHGGVMDRFDSIFIACPAVFLYLLVMYGYAQ